MRKLIYVASPYSSPYANVAHDRYIATMEYCASLVKQQQFVFSPIVHWHPCALYCELPTDFHYWKEYNFYMLLLSDQLNVLTLDGWKESIGVMGEIAFAQSQNIPICYVT